MPTLVSALRAGTTEAFALCAIDVCKSLSSRRDVVAAIAHARGQYENDVVLFNALHHAFRVHSQKETKSGTTESHGATQDKSAPLCTKQRGQECAERLHALFEPYLLRRCKASTRLVTVCAARTTGDQGEHSVVTGALTEAAATSADPKAPALPAKTDLVVWLQLHPVQRQAYQVCSDLPHKDVFCCFVLTDFCS
jgi:hypothetical protein